MELDLNTGREPQQLTEIVCLETNTGNQTGIRTWNNGCEPDQVFTGENGLTINEADILNWSAGKCLERQPECSESQEWTYGIDNTGTIYNDIASYAFELSDGSTLEFSQDGSSTSWTPQLQEWAANVQQAATDAGLSWFVEPRFLTSTNLVNGGYGLAGAPSEPIGKGLYDGGMRWRYLNIQICAGQPVPVRAYRKTSVRYGDGEFNLTSAGAFLGPIVKFKRCAECGENADTWYVLDEANDGTYREATAGEIPNCAEPCGTLALADSPPDRDCSFIFDVACDNNNSVTTADFTNAITRRSAICNGEQSGLDYFEEDPSDPNALIPYTLVGEFVDCATGEPVKEPIPDCDDFEINTMWKKEGFTSGLRNREWVTAESLLPMGDLEAAEDFIAGFDYSITPDTDTVVVTNVAALNDSDDTASVLDFQLREGYLVVDKPLTVRWTTTSEGTLIVDLGVCGSNYETVVSLSKSVGAQSTDSYEIPVGIHKVRIYNVDNGGTNSSWTLQTSDDGISFANNNSALDSISSTTLPSFKCVSVKTCKPTGLTYDYSTGEDIDVTELLTCPVTCVKPDTPYVDTCLTPTGLIKCHASGKAQQYISCEDNKYSWLDTDTAEIVDPSELVSCEGEYDNFDNERLCEIDAEYLLLIDSGGRFGRYSFYTDRWELVSTLSVASAGGSADVDNFLLYNFVAPDQMTVIDVNTDTQLPNVTVIDGVINPDVLTNPKTFSAASFRKSDGYLYAWDTAGADSGLYKVNVTTGQVDFVTKVTGVSGTGTSLMIDNLSDKLIINGSNFSYDVDWVTGVGTVWGNPPLQPNGGTFDTDGNAYVTSGNSTYKLLSGLDPNVGTNWVEIIDDFTYGANSLAYYKVESQKPACFNRRYGINDDGTRELIGDFNVADDSPRTVVGDIDCCTGGGSSDSGSAGISDVFVQNFPASQTINGTVSVDNFPDTQTIDGVVDVGNWPDEVDLSLVVETGLNTNVPAGFKSVTITSLTGETTINGVYRLGSGRLPSSQSFGTDRGNYINEILPAYALAGGTWQWIGHR